MGYEGPEGEQKYSCILSSTSELDGGGWSMPRPSHFAPEQETHCPLCRMLGGPQGQSGQVQKISPPLGLDTQTVQPITTELSRPIAYIKSMYILFD